MLRRSCQVLGKSVALRSVRQYTGLAPAALPTVAHQTEEWSLFPNQREGNIYSVNWSLCEDGVVPVGDAFRNARLSLLTTKIGKAEAGKITASKPVYIGSFALKEAGDSISHDDFDSLFAAQQQHLSSGQTLFVEDASLGALGSVRNGVRVTGDDAATALIARTLLIPSPPQDVNHRARFKGWNHDARWKEISPQWNGSTYDFPDDLPKSPAKEGQRPIVAFVGGNTSELAVQFVENSGEIVGANIMAGSGVPVRGLIEAIGLAGTVLVNVQHPTAVALSCTTVCKGKDTVVIVGADDATIEELGKAGLLFGVYHNILTPAGVTPLWNGYLSSSSAASSSKGHADLPSVAVNGVSAVAINPHNLAHPAKHFVFFEKGASKSKLSTEEAVKRLVNLSEESKAEAIKGLLQGATVTVVGNANDVKSVL